MKKLLAACLVAGLVAFTGCNKSEPGGPGASPGSKKGDSPSSPRASASPRSDSPRGDGGRADEGGGQPKNVAVDKKNTFKISGPGLGVASTNIKQGASETVTLKVDRGQDFKETVTLKFDDDKKGLKFEATPAKVTPGDKEEVQVKVTADEKADLGKHKVVVTATPSSGEPVTHEITFDVKAK